MTIPPDTERLSFRAWSPDDLDTFHSLCADPRVMQHVADGRPWSRETSGQFIERARSQLAACGYCQWPLIHKADQLLIGFCGFATSKDGPEIGWRLAPAYWGRGLASEAARAVLKHGFESLGFERVIATVQAANRASLRIVEKLGMTDEVRIERYGREVLVFAIDYGSYVAGDAASAER